VFGLLTGAVADRVDTRYLLLVADGGRFVLLALILVAVSLGLPSIEVIIAATIPIYALRSVWLSGNSAVMPMLVDRRHLALVFSWTEAIFSLGPAVAGVLIVAASDFSAVSLAAGLFAISATLVLTARRPLLARDTSVPGAWLADIREGIGFVVRRPQLRAAVAFWSALSVISAGIIPVLAFTVQIHEHGSDALFGVVIGMYSFGTIVGALGAPHLARGHLGNVMVAGGGLFALSAAVAAVSPNIQILVVCSFAMGLGLEAVLIPYMTLRSLIAPRALMGRVTAVARMSSLGFQPLGMLASGLLIGSVGGPLTLLVIGASGLVFTVLFARSSARNTHVDSIWRPTDAGPGAVSEC
jgi:MFS family permease